MRLWLPPALKRRAKFTAPLRGALCTGFNLYCRGHYLVLQCALQGPLGQQHRSTSLPTVPEVRSGSPQSVLNYFLTLISRRLKSPFANSQRNFENHSPVFTLSGVISSSTQPLLNRVSFFIYLARTDHCALVAVDREEAMHLWQNDSTSLQLTPEIEQTPIQSPGNDSY